MAKKEIKLVETEVESDKEFELQSVEFYQSEMNKIADDTSKREEFFALKELRNLALKQLNNL